MPKGKNKISPLIICQYGHSSSPDDDVFGLIYYAQYGYKLVKDGFAVLAPLNITMTEPMEQMIQTGKADGVSWWLFVLEEFEKSKEYYKKLMVEERIQMCLHNAGHEIRFEEELKFLRKWL